jgi:sugar phosphate isomerase/epimerase
VDEYDTGICFDTGHALTRYSGDESVIEFYKAHKDRIIEFHLHDGIYEEREGAVIHDDHIALGTGEMPIRELLMEVAKDKFNGPVIFELTSTETIESLRKIKEVVPEALG